MVISGHVQTILASLFLDLLSNNNSVLFPTLVTYVVRPGIPNNCNVYIRLLRAKTCISAL